MGFDMKTLTGSIVALVTPMKEQGEIDYAALDQLVEWHVAEKTDGLVVIGTTGESPVLSEEEFVKVVKAVHSKAAGRIPVIAGTGTNNTVTTISKTQKAQEIGVDGALIVTPYYNKPTQMGLIAHYKAVAAAADKIPIILYNVPGRTACDLLPETCAELCKIPNIIGVKEAAGKMERFTKFRELCGPDWRIYSGEDFNACDAILQGANGVITVTGNVFPGLEHIMCAAAVAKDEAKAKQVDAVLAPIHKILFVEPSPCPTKWALTHLGRISGGIRLPLVPMTSAHHGPMREALDAVMKVEDSLKKKAA